jgi:hypothetical protein
MRYLVLFIASMLLAFCRTVPSTPTVPTAPTAADPNRDDLAEVRRMIAGREQEPAENVFKNVVVLRGMPAGRFVNVMDVAFSRALGTCCTHCHQDDWDHDTLQAKKTAREMWKMMLRLNQELLRPIPMPSGHNPAVNCTTCHRGQLTPALNLP